VGAAKSYACERARGDLLVELDHDDILADVALASLWAEHEQSPDVGFFYSDTAQVNEDLSRNDDRWDARYGWEYYEAEVNGEKYLASVALEPSPHNISFIWWAPNHVRAFTREAYEKSGGYSADRTILDDQDLMCRLFCVTEFKRIAQCLYLQRLHGEMTQRQPDTHAQIQRECIELHDSYIEQMSLAWARRQGLEALDLGAAHGKPEGFSGVDKHAAPGVDYVGDVFAVLRAMKPGSAGVVRAVDFLEHVADKVKLMNAIWRVLAPGGMLLAETPSTDGRGAFQDPTHVSYFNENSFWYYSNVEYAKYVPEIKCRFQVSRNTSYFPGQFHRDFNIPYVRTHLVAPKNGPRQGGEYLW
jgi:hypothetical protein